MSCRWFSTAVFPLKTCVLHLDLESDNHRGDETHTDREEVVGEVTVVQKQFMV